MTTRYAKLTPEKLAYLRSLLDYDSSTGLFRWKVRTHSHGGTIEPGDIAGTRGPGRVQIGVDGVTYRAHVMAYWFMTGENVPLGCEIDHRDRNDNNNRWENLRLVPRSVNNHNSDPSAANTSGVRGVSWVTGGNCWHARITNDGIVHILGDYAEFTEAVRARVAAEERLFGEVFSKHALGLTAPLYQPPLKRAGPDLRKLPGSRVKVATTLRSTNTSGYAGIRKHPKSGRWVVGAAGRWVGSYATLEEAVAARELKLAEAYTGDTVLSVSERAALPRQDGRTTAQGARNQAERLREGNTTGCPGVYEGRAGCFVVKFRNKTLGRYSTLEEAIAVRKEAVERHYEGRE